MGTRPLLPPGEISDLDNLTAPRDNAGSCSFEDGVAGPMFGGEEPVDHLAFFEHPLYAEYMRMPKGLLRPNDAGKLRDVHEGLAGEVAARFLHVSGWAAAEAALVMRGVRNNQKTRESLLEGAANTWSRALERVAVVRAAGPENPDHHTLKERIDLALASIPLLEGIIRGGVTEGTLARLRSGYVRVGLANAALEKKAVEAKDEVMSGFHKGLSCELVALLGLNGEATTRRFAMTATARNDSGYHFPNFTHDLVAFRQRVGVIKSMLPAEVKVRTSKRDRKRYQALVLDGKFMDVIDAGEPGPMLRLLARVYEGDGSEDEALMAESLTNRLWAIVGQYSAGRPVEVAGNRHSALEYHDTSQVRLGGYALARAAAV